MSGEVGMKLWVFKKKTNQKENKDKVKKDITGLVGLDGRLIPISLMIKTYFAQEQSNLDNFQAELDQAVSEMEEMKEEQGGDEGLLSDVVNEKGNVTKGDLNKRLKEVKDEPDSKEELDVLQ